MANKTERTIKNHQEIFELYDKFFAEEGDRANDLSQYFFKRKIAEITTYSISYVGQVLNGRYKGDK